MRYVSPEQRLIGPEAAFEESRVATLWERVVDSMGEGRFWAVVLVLAMSLTVAKSTATVRWVDGIDVIPAVALAGALLMSALAISPVRDVVALGIGLLLSPLSTADRTLEVESGLFSNWAQLQERLSRPGLIGTSLGGTGVTGFSDDVKLSGSLRRTRDIVFTYTIIGDYAGPRYFRGVDETVTLGGEWRYSTQAGARQLVAKNQAYPYTQDHQQLAGAGVEVRMLHPPVPPDSDVVFYPGQLYRIDRLTLGSQVPVMQPFNGPESALLYTLDRLSSVQPTSSAGL